ncbi:MAG: DeoR/GlpR transcriptional regulator [Caldilineaceae bacterium]|nr:DeoR/GlpR transcriptional regulator [Caldilineaceae bacterium]
MAAILGAVRKDKILSYLRDHSSATVVELSELCEVSEVTIRQDLNQLAGEGLLVRTRGGAVLSSRANSEFTFATRAAINAEAKQKIGELAATFVQSGDSVIVDSSTTALYVVRALAQRYDLEDVTVITNGMNTALELANRLEINTFVTGGHLHMNGASLSGSFAWDMVGKIYATVGFFGTRGITVEHGLTEVNMQEAAVKQKMLDRCQEIIIVADGSKFGQVALTPFAPVDRAHRIITDETAPEHAILRLKAMGIDVITA